MKSLKFEDVLCDDDSEFMSTQRINCDQLAASMEIH